VNSPEAVYDRAAYIAAVGYGPARRDAEQGALVALTALFGQSIQGELKTLNTYSEAVKNGAVDVSENTSAQNAINISARMDSLVGAEIADVWFDGRSAYYAVAVMERAPAAFLYADMIRANGDIIRGLTAIPPGEKNSLESYSRYQLAAVIADANQVFSNVLSVVAGGPAGGVPGDLKRGDDYRLEAMEVARNIPISVNAVNDPSGRIKNAFAAALNRAGFRSGGGDTRYVLEAALALNPVELPNQQNKFIRYDVEANLKDREAGDAVLLPFSVNGREGHLTLAEAENRALGAAVRKIDESYGAALSSYLSVRSSAGASAGASAGNGPDKR
jgi:hypothetical protein